MYLPDCRQFDSEMIMDSKLRWLLAGLSVFVALNTTAQGDFWQRTQLGVQWGFTGSQVYFNPRIAEMSWLQGASYGFVIRHYSDKHMGIQLEVNRVQKGWTEKYDNFWYRRRLEYWEIPLMTHVVLGKGALQAIINAGPYVAFGAKSAEYVESDATTLHANGMVNLCITMWNMAWGAD